MPRPAPPRASFIQERLWARDRLCPDGMANHVSVALRVTGALDVGALRRALQRVVARHDVLRTRLVPSTDGLTQVVEHGAELPFAHRDLRRTGRALPRASVLGLAEFFARKTFGFEEPCKLRGLLLQLDDDEFVLVLVIHAVASDGWSMGVLAREAGQYYAADTEGRVAHLPELTVAYADYAAGQRRSLDGGEFDGQLSYWRSQLAGALPALALPTDRPRSQVRAGARGAVDVVLGREVSRELCAIARAERASLYMVLLAGWAWTLGSYARTDDVVVGSRMEARCTAELEGLIGPLATTMALRIDVTSQPTFRELVRRSRATAFAAFERLDVPFEQLVSELNVPHGGVAPPLFHSNLKFQVGLQPVPAVAGLGFEVLELGERLSDADLMLSLAESHTGEVRGSLVYDADLFDESTMERLTARFEQLLEEGAASADKTLARGIAGRSAVLVDQAAPGPESFRAI